MKRVALKRSAWKRTSKPKPWMVRRQREALKSSRPTSADTSWRKAVLARDEDTCQRCGRQGVILHAHHIATRKRRPDLKHDLDNGLTVCGECHKWIHDNPAESTAQGFLSDSSYEKARKAA